MEDVPLRRASGKNDEGRITVAIEEEADHIVISCTDDGRGIDIKELRQKARTRGLAEAASSDQEIVELLLTASFSTKDSVSQISGRGVGLSAVVESFQSLGGEVALDLSRARSAESFDFVLKITLPKKSVFITDDKPSRQTIRKQRLLSLVSDSAS